MKLPLVAIALSALLLPQHASAGSLTTRELAENCRAYLADPTSERGQICSAYVQGFLQGSSRVREDPDQEKDDGQESWSERAARTRVGSRLERDRPEPRYCFDTLPDVRDVVQQLLELLPEVPDQAKDAAETLTAALVRNYPCT